MLFFIRSSICNQIVTVLLLNFHQVYGIIKLEGTKTNIAPIKQKGRNTMRHIKALAAILIAALTLTGCSRNENSTSDGDGASSAQSAAADSSIVTSDTSDTSSTSSTTNTSSSAESTSEISNAPESKPESSLTSTSSTPETSKPEETSEPAEPVYQTEFEQALAVLSDLAYIDYEMHPIDSNFPEGLVDTSQFVADVVDYDENSKPQYTSDSTFYKVVGGPVRTEEQFNNLLNNIFTEKLKQSYTQNPERKFRFKDGDLYIAGYGAGGVGLGMSYLEFNSFEHLDENTILMKVTSVGDKEEWGLDEDIRDETTIKFVKGSDGKLRIDECDVYNASQYFGFYREIVSGDISISL